MTMQSLNAAAEAAPDPALIAGEMLALLAEQAQLNRRVVQLVQRIVRLPRAIDQLVDAAVTSLEAACAAPPPAAEPEDKVLKVLKAWETGGAGPSEIARDLGLPESWVSGFISTGRKAQDPRVIAGDRRREASPQPPAPKPVAESRPAAAPAAAPVTPKPTPAPPEPPTLSERVWDAYAAKPAGSTELASRLGLPASNVSALLSIGRKRGDARVIAGDDALKARAAARPKAVARPGALNPVQMRAQAALRNKVLDHYATTGDHPRVVAVKCDCTQPQVDAIMKDAGPGEPRMRLGNLRRNRQLRGGK